MNAVRILGVVILVVGVVLLAMGINATQSTGEELREGLTGKYSSATVWYIIGGIVCLVGGGALALFGGRYHGLHHGPRTPLVR